MNDRATIDDFLGHKRHAFVGVSASGKKFGNVLFKELSIKGYELLPVHPSAKEIQGKACAPSLKELDGEVDGLILCVPPEKSEQVVREAAEAGIKRVWMQQGAQSDAAVQFCRDHDIAEVHGRCLLMFADGTGFPHSFHRWLNGVLGRLPS